MAKKDTTDITVKGIDRGVWLRFKADCKRKGLTVKGGIEQALRAQVLAVYVALGGSK